MDTDFRRFADFMMLHATDSSYEASFRARFDEPSQRTKEQVATVHSIWRINNKNRQLVEQVLARVAEFQPSTPLETVLQAIKTQGIQSIDFETQPSTCIITNTRLNCGRKLKLNTADDKHPPVEYIVRSDIVPLLRFFNVISHFVHLTVLRFASVSTDAHEIETHYQDWICCRKWLEKLATALGSLPKPTR